MRSLKNRVLSDETTPAIAISGGYDQLKPAPYITGLWGCHCHPFKSWEDHDWYAKQKLVPGQLVMIRHTEEFAYIIDKSDQGQYYNINRLPCAVPRDMTIEHVTNLISEKKFTKTQLRKFQLHSNFKEIRKSLVDFSQISRFGWKKVFLCVKGVNVCVYRSLNNQPVLHDYYTISNLDMYRLNAPYCSRMKEFVQDCEAEFRNNNIQAQWMLF